MNGSKNQQEKATRDNPELLELITPFFLSVYLL